LYLHKRKGIKLIIYLILQDWTLICTWLTVVFSVVYFIFGDFFEEYFVQEDKEDEKEEKKPKDSR